MPSVKELEAFIAVVEAGSFQGAARRLNATPPAISKRISELESELGVRLFERSTRSCRITSRGRALVPFAQRVLGDIGEIRRTIGERSSLSGHVRLGVVETIAFTQLPEVLRKVSADLHATDRRRRSRRDHRSRSQGAHPRVGHCVRRRTGARIGSGQRAVLGGPIVLDRARVEMDAKAADARGAGAGDDIAADRGAPHRHDRRVVQEQGIARRPDHHVQQPDHGGEDDRDRHGHEPGADRMCAA